MATTSSAKTAPVPSPAVPLNLMGDLTRVSTPTLRRRSVSNLLKMGHCAPAVMQTLLDASDKEAEWLVKLTAGLPGGIGNTGAECGGVTAPLILIGLRHARDAVREGLPPMIDKGHDLLQRFAGCHGTTLCREIRGTDRLPLRCVGAVRRAPELCAQTLSSGCADVIPAASRDAFADDVNKFNRVMNLGHELAKWFTGGFGSTQCRRITRCDFSTTEGVNQYIDTDGVARCQVIAHQVAAKVERMIDSAV